MHNLTAAASFLPDRYSTIGYSADVAQPFDTYRERVRQHHEQRLNDLTGSIRHLMRRGKDAKLLDLGCGTGFFTIPLARKLGCVVVGADRSAEMLSIAKRKSGSNMVRWEQEEATSLSYRSGEFDVVFMSNLLHHFDNPSDVLRQCMRVLSPGGILLNHYGALEDIINDPEHRFFPETVAIDVKRTPTQKQVETWFRQVSLRNISTNSATYKICNSASERIESVENKYISVLHMITPGGFSKGLQLLKEHAASNTCDQSLLETTVKTTYGRKTGRTRPLNIA